MGAYTVLISVGESDRARVTALLAALLPDAGVRDVERGSITELPPAAALIVDDVDSAMLARASAFPGGIVVIGAPKKDELAALRAQGACVVAPDAAASALGEALARAMPLGPDGAPQPVHDALFQARRLLAAGEMALTIQHDFNNPLAALLAEAQMLQMDAPTPDVQAAAGRMLVLVRRLTELSRLLDTVRERTPGAE